MISFDPNMSCKYLPNIDPNLFTLVLLNVLLKIC